MSRLSLTLTGVRRTQRLRGARDLDGSRLVIPHGHRAAVSQTVSLLIRLIKPYFSNRSGCSSSVSTANQHCPHIRSITANRSPHRTHLGGSDAIRLTPPNS